MATNTITDHKAIQNTSGIRGTHKTQMQEEDRTDTGKQDTGEITNQAGKQTVQSFHIKQQITN